MSDKKGTNWKLIGGVVLSVAVAGIAVYVISKNIKEKKDGKKKKRLKKAKQSKTKG